LNGAPGALLRIGQGAGHSLYTSRPLLLELAGILSRPKFAKKIAASHLSADQLVELYAGCVNLVKPLPVGRVASDPDDDQVLGTALAAKAETLVTGDKGLLALQTFESIRILNAQQSLDALHAN
jgi:putative PIN family toxin of toxin-antitoxin system